MPKSKPQTNGGAPKHAPDRNPIAALLATMREFRSAGAQSIHFDALAMEWHDDTADVEDLMILAEEAIKDGARFEPDAAQRDNALRLIAGVAAIDLTPYELTITKLDRAEDALGEIQGIVRKTMEGQPLPAEPATEHAALVEKIARMSIYGDGPDDIAPDGEDAMRVLNHLIASARTMQKGAQE